MLLVYIHVHYYSDYKDEKNIEMIIESQTGKQKRNNLTLKGQDT